MGPRLEILLRFSVGSVSPESKGLGSFFPPLRAPKNGGEDIPSDEHSSATHHQTGGIKNNLGMSPQARPS